MNIRLEKTCSACPEQYDAYVGDQQVGYLRLRHGYFRVDYLYCGGELLYDTYTKGDGMFMDDEREYHLNKAIEVIKEKLLEDGCC